MNQYNAQIWSDLHALGLNDIGAAGVMGNMSQESSMNPAEHGGGLMQWIGGRWSALVSYANSRGLDPKSEAAQVGYFGQELKAGNEGITLQSLNSQKSPAAAALLVSEKYERPAASAANNPHREAEANNFYSQYSGKSAANFPAPNDPGGLPGLTQTSAGSSTTEATPYPQGSDVIQIIDKSMSLQGFDVFHPGQSLEQDAGAIGLRVVLVILGLILFVFGLVAIVEKASGGAVPIPV